MRTIRLNRFLAMAGLGSRRKVEKIILSGEVSINDEVVLEPSYQVIETTDIVKVKGVLIKPTAKKNYLILNKPKGYIVTKQDEYNRKTIYRLLPDFAQNCLSAGRLDKDTEGLLLITDDGDVIHALTHPTKNIPKVYRAVIDQPINKDQLETLRKGVVIDGYQTRSAGIFIKKNQAGNTVLKIVISEGKKRQIRLMFEAVSRKVLQLKRLQIGELVLGKLPIGMWRLCTEKEIKYLQSLTKRRK